MVNRRGKGKGRLIATGFASPADDFLERPLDLNSYIVKNPSATFFFRYEGEGFDLRNVMNGDLLVVDRSLTPVSGDLVVVVCGDEFILREIKIKSRKIYLLSDTGLEDPVLCGNFEIWGVVTHIIRNLRHK